MSLGTKTRRRFLAVAAGVVPPLLAGCAGGDGEAEDEEADEVVLVGADGDNRFEPEELAISVGDTVEFRWESDGHTLLVDNQPDGSDWERHPVSQDEGHTVTHTFDVAGQYDIYCSHHRQSMQATIVVEE